MAEAAATRDDTICPDGLPRNDPRSRWFWHHGSKTYSRFPGEHTRASWEPIGQASMAANAELPDD